MLTRRMVAVISVAVVVGVASAAFMAWAAGLHPAGATAAPTGQCGGSCMMKAMGPGGGGCPMAKAAQTQPAGYFKVNAKSQALWTKMGKLIDQHRSAMWQLFTVESQKTVSQTKLTAAREHVASLAGQIAKTRTALTAYWQPSASTAAAGPAGTCGCGAGGGPGCGCVQKTK